MTMEALLKSRPACTEPILAIDAAAKRHVENETTSEVLRDDVAALTRRTDQALCLESLRLGRIACVSRAFAHSFCDGQLSVRPRRFGWRINKIGVDHS